MIIPHVRVSLHEIYDELKCDLFILCIDFREIKNMDLNFKRGTDLYQPWEYAREREREVVQYGSKNGGGGGGGKHIISSWKVGITVKGTTRMKQKYVSENSDLMQDKEITIKTERNNKSWSN